MAPAPILALALAAIPWLDPTSVKPLQRGVCVTEWTGGERREIPVEVLGVLDAPAPERTSVLIRLLDDKLAGTGVVMGMSGSPVYIDGRLLGALASGFAFAREPLGAVTPFAAMQGIEEQGAEITAAAPKLAQIAALAARTAPPISLLPELGSPEKRGVMPVAVVGIPISTGLGEEILARAGLQAIPAGSHAGIAGIPEAGEMVAALLVWGDAIVAAAGTVTAREGEKMWAFGHPFLGLGRLRVPAARARVVAVQDSYQVPFKIFTVGEQFGTFVADRPAGMLAVVGTPPDGLPVTVTVEEGGSSHTWSFRTAAVPILQPLLVTYLANACLTARGAATGDASVQLEMNLRLEDGQRLGLRQATRGIDALARISALAGAACSFVENSTFAHPALAGVEIVLRRDERLTGATIAEVVTPRTVVAPGELLTIDVRLQPYLAGPVTKRLELRVPPTLPNGAIDLIVADGAAFADYHVQSLAVQPASFADQLSQVELLESASTLVAALESREGGVAYRGTSQKALPPSWSATLVTGLGRRGVERLKTTFEATVRWQAPYPLEGAYRIPLTVRTKQEVQ